MNTAHTLGPWEFVDNALVGPKIDDKPIWLRPVILRSEVGVRQSDAQLIAAAPELLEALRELTDDIADRFDMNSPSTNPGMKSTINSARAAINKATGAAA